MRLIDADFLKEEAGKYYSGNALDIMLFNGFVNDYAPTVDAEPVVHCKDCKHFYDMGSYEVGSGTCRIKETHRPTVKHNDFCSCGAKIDEDSLNE